MLVMDNTKALIHALNGLKIITIGYRHYLMF